MNTPPTFPLRLHAAAMTACSEVAADGSAPMLHKPAHAEAAVSQAMPGAAPDWRLATWRDRGCQKTSNPVHEVCGAPTAPGQRQCRKRAASVLPNSCTSPLSCHFHDSRSSLTKLYGSVVARCRNAKNCFHRLRSSIHVSSLDTHASRCGSAPGRALVAAHRLSPSRMVCRGNTASRAVVAEHGLSPSRIVCRGNTASRAVVAEHGLSSSRMVCRGNTATCALVVTHRPRAYGRA